MSAAAIRIVTVSREFGAGGGEYSRTLAARLGWPVLDHELVHRVAARLRMADEAVERFDEHPPSLLARIASVLVIPSPETYDFPPPGEVPSHDAIAAATTRTIREAGAHPPVVIVGHGAACILAGRPDALHVFLHAPFEQRVRSIVGRLHVAPAAAPAVVRHADHERAAYVQRYFHTDWRDGALYDLQFGTGNVTVTEAVTLTERLIGAREPEPRPEGARSA